MFSISFTICQIAGTIIHDLDPMGLLETNGDEDSNVKGTSYSVFDLTLWCQAIYVWKKL